jgi:hypothetical protein
MASAALACVRQPFACVFALFPLQRNLALVELLPLRPISSRNVGQGFLHFL